MKSARKKLENALMPISARLSEMGELLFHPELAKAKILNTASENENALALINNKLKRIPEHKNRYRARYLLFRAFLHCELGAFDSSLEDCQSVIECIEKPWQAYKQKAIVHLCKGEYHLSLCNIEKALDIEPHSAELLVIKSCTLNWLAEYKASIDCATKSISIQPINPEAFGYRAEARQFLGEIDNAISDARESIRLNSEDPDPLPFVILSMALCEKKQTGPAMEACNKALRLNASNPRALLARARIHLSSGEFEEALKDCDKLQEMHIEDASVLLTKSEALLGMNSFNESLSHCIAALRLDAANPRAYRTRAKIYENLGDHEAAREDRMRAETLS